jgi:hypothetical protein
MHGEPIVIRGIFKSSCLQRRWKTHGHQPFSKDRTSQKIAGRIKEKTCGQREAFAYNHSSHWAEENTNPSRMKAMRFQSAFRPKRVNARIGKDARESVEVALTIMGLMSIALTTF